MNFTKGICHKPGDGNLRILGSLSAANRLLAPETKEQPRDQRPSRQRYDTPVFPKENDLRVRSFMIIYGVFMGMSQCFPHVSHQYNYSIFMVGFCLRSFAEGSPETARQFNKSKTENQHGRGSGQSVITAGSQNEPFFSRLGWSARTVRNHHSFE